jgi:DNA polymerase epsilon subunit 1
MIGGASLACDFMISQKPFGSKITERAIPVIIFKEEPAVRHHYLKKWLKDNTISADIDVREIIDWKYYITRLNSTIQKIVTIPAALQGLPNPVPRVAHPDWLEKKVRERDSGMRQQKLSSFFTKQQGAAPPPGELMDLEEIGSTKSVPEPRKQPMIRQFFKSSGIEVLHDYEDRERGGRDDDGMEHADIDADFRRWVKTSKPKWKNILAERQQRRQAGIAPRERQSSASSVSNYFMRQSVVASRESWQIIHIVQDAPSTFMAWALVGGSNLQRLRIQIPRVVYVNSFDEQPALADCKVRRVLPRSRPCLNLYREVLPEKREAELQMMMSDPAVEGVYEAQTPQIFKAAMKLGGVCSLAAHARPDSSGAFTLEQIETSAQSVYLQPENIRLHRVWMYHSHSGKDRAVLGLFDAEARSAFLYVVSRQAGRVERVNTQRILRELQMPEDFSCNLTYASVLSVAQNGMQRELARLQKDRTAATVLILQSPLTLAVHLQTIRALGDMPVVCMPANLHDNDYPALGWETPIVRKMIRRSLAVDEWWNYQVELARFAHIPIGNVEPDSISFITDVSYARHLSAQNYCLWCSSAALPDLGGNEEEGGITEMDDSVKNCEGAYRTICVELDLFGLAVNTVLNSDLVDDIEGASHVFDEAACTDVDDAAATMPAFAVLKTMVDRWHKQAQAGSMWANELLMNFYRWLRSPTSKLYDPRLFRTVHNMIYKVFLQLMGEFRSLGATIVSACFNKVILCTGKDNIETAKQYLDYLLDTIATSDKQLFSKVRFIRRAWWRCLLYKDRANYGGIRLNVPDDDLGIDDQSNSQHAYATADPMDETTNDENAASRMNIEADAEVDAHTSAEMDTDDVATTNSEVANDDFHDKVEINFNVAKYLPKDLQLYFDRIVAEFILVPVKEARALQAEQLNNPQSTQHNYESIAISLGEVVRTTMTRTLCRMVDAIDKKCAVSLGCLSCLGLLSDLPTCCTQV